MKTDKEVLEGAIKLIEGEGHWCKGAYCTGFDGKAMTSQFDTATAFCLEGALRVTAGFWSSERYELTSITHQARRLELMLAVLSGHVKSRLGGRIFPYNDDPNTTQEDAILLLKRGLEEIDK